MAPADRTNLPGANLAVILDTAASIGAWGFYDLGDGDLNVRGRRVPALGTWGVTSLATLPCSRASVALLRRLRRITPTLAPKLQPPGNPLCVGKSKAFYCPYSRP